jgi:hypothetical protein
MFALLVILALGVIAILAVALRLAIDVRAIRAELLPDIHAELRRQAGSYYPLAAVGSMRHAHIGRPGWYAVWVWSDGVWQLVPDPLPAGADPGPPPPVPGHYPGQTIKNWIPGPQR